MNRDILSTPLDLASGELAERVEPELVAALNKREELIKQQVFSVIREGETLDPQLAVQKWLQLFAMEELKSALRASKRKAAVASRAIERNLT